MHTAGSVHAIRGERGCCAPVDSGMLLEHDAANHSGREEGRRSVATKTGCCLASHCYSSLMWFRVEAWRKMLADARTKHMAAGSVRLESVPGVRHES